MGLKLLHYLPANDHQTNDKEEKKARKRDGNRLLERYDWSLVNNFSFEKPIVNILTAATKISCCNNFPIPVAAVRLLVDKVFS